MLNPLFTQIRNLLWRWVVVAQVQFLIFDHGYATCKMNSHTYTRIQVRVIKLSKIGLDSHSRIHFKNLRKYFLFVFLFKYIVCLVWSAANASIVYGVLVLYNLLMITDVYTILVGLKGLMFYMCIFSIARVSRICICQFFFRHWNKNCMYLLNQVISWCDITGMFS